MGLPSSAALPPGRQGAATPWTPWGRAASGSSRCGPSRAEGSGAQGPPTLKAQRPSPGGQERLRWGSVTLVAFYESTARPRRASRLHTPSRDRKSKDPSWEASRT